MRRRRARARARVAWLVVTMAVVGGVGTTFLMYRRSLQRPDPYGERTARNDPQRLSVRRIAVRHPTPMGGGLTWSRISLPIPSNDPSTVGRLVVATWAAKVAESCGLPAAMPTVSHFFFDERRTAYVDLEPSFLAGCAVGTAGERELLDSLEETLRANLPATGDVVVMAGGVPLETVWAHLSARPWRRVR